MTRAPHTGVRLLCALAALAPVACGQKGPPLKPIVYLPRPVTELTVRRVEQDVVVQFTVPTANADSTSPADLRRIEVYAHTGPLPAPADFLEYGTLVAAVDIKDPSETPPTPAGETSGAETPETPPSAASTPAGQESVTLEIAQGWKAAVRETLTDAHREPGRMPPARTPPATPASAAAAPVLTLETPGTINFELPPSRYYTVVPVSESRGRRGAFAGPLAVPLLDVLPAPPAPDVTYSEKAITLSWSASPEDIELPTAATASDTTVQAPEMARLETEDTIELYADVETEGTVNPPAAVPPAKPVKPPQPRFGYRIYDLAALPVQPIAGVPPDQELPGSSLNSVLLTTPTFSDSRIEFGTERCYAIRRVEMAGVAAIESAPSPPVCVTPMDKFPPTAPKDLVSIPSGGGVSLLWQANTEGDLGGYVVLRGEAPGDTLSPLTPAPINDTTYTDTTPERGRTYVYAVVAVDQSTPANVSELSNRVEETIR